MSHPWQWPMHVLLGAALCFDWRLRTDDVLQQAPPPMPPAGPASPAQASKPKGKAKWTLWDLNPGPSACEADVMPLHHEPLMLRAQIAAKFWLCQTKSPGANCKHPGRGSNQTAVQLAQARSTLWIVMWAPAAAPGQPPLSSHKPLHSNTHKPTGHNRF